MRRQNPPSEHIEKALELEHFLNPFSIASMYAIVGILFALLLSFIYAILVRTYVLNPTPLVTGLFEVVGGVPLVFAVWSYFVMPHDPVSLRIKRLADAWRRPLDVFPDECVFHQLLMDGEALYFKLCFYYPAQNHTSFVKERLYSYANGALTKECSKRVSVPTDREVEQIVDSVLEVLASECDIPVLYAEIREVFKLRGAYSKDLSPTEFWRTGTHY